jgi:sulfate-transporting ATPase
MPRIFIKQGIIQMAEKIIFSMSRVSKTYPGKKTVIKDISLSFYYGAKIGVLGLKWCR